MGVDRGISEVVEVGGAERMSLSELARREPRYSIWLKTASQIVEELGFYEVSIKEMRGPVLAVWRTDMSMEKGRMIFMGLYYEHLRHYSKRNDKDEFEFHLRIWIE